MHNYNKVYGNKVEETVETLEEVVENVEVNDEIAEEVIEETVAETVEAPVEPKSGTVVGCKNLRVREQPIATNDLNVICEIKEGTKILIAEDDSTGDWYKVCLENGVEGYCMKKFINLAS